MGTHSNARLVLVIDGQGGGIGVQLVKLLAPRLPAECELCCVGTHSLAPNAMLKAGAARGATGENAVCHNAAQADLIVGPVGIIMANGIMGEVSPGMSVAVSGARAQKVLIPSSTCGIHVAGAEGLRLDEYLHRAADTAVRLLSE